MIALSTRLRKSLDEFSDAATKALEQASAQAVKATANDVIKLTLPNTLDNIDTSKPASKQKGVFKSNVKRLQKRIKENIMGKGIEGEDGVATAFPGKNGKPIKKTIKGKSYYGIFLTAKPKGSKRRVKIKNQNINVADTVPALISFIKSNTELARKKVTYRRRKSRNVIWVTKVSVIKQAAEQMSKRAGNLLSGWSQLAAKTESNMMTILSAQTVDKNGSASISVKNGKVTFKATNDESHGSISSYQQRMVDSNVPRSFKYHLENAIKNINWNKLRKSSIK